MLAVAVAHAHADTDANTDVDADADLEAPLAAFARATPTLLAERALLRRIDLKYTLDRDRLGALLAALAADYAVLPVGAGAAAIELSPRHRGGGHAPVLYESLALLHPGREAELHADLGARLGVQVLRVQIHRIDLLRDAAEITAYYGAPVLAPARVSAPGAAAHGAERPGSSAAAA